MAGELEDEGTAQGPGRRCDIGCESWPDDDAYDLCPRCGGPTTRYTNLYPMDVFEAHSIAAHLDFEDYYHNDWPEERDAWLRDHPEHDWRSDPVPTSVA